MSADELNADFLKAKDKALISIGREPATNLLSPEEKQAAVQKADVGNVAEQFKYIKDMLILLNQRHNVLVEAFNTTTKELRDQFGRLERILKGETKLQP